MSAGSSPFYVCLLAVLTGLAPSSRAVLELNQQTLDAASHASTRQKQEPPETTSPLPEHSQQQPQGSAAPSRTPMTSAELISELNQPEAAVKNHVLVFNHKTISGDLVLDVEQLPVPFRVEFHDCEFQDNVRIQYVVFEESLVFDGVLFDKEFSLDGSHIKGDLIVHELEMAHWHDPSQPDKPRVTTLQLNQVQVDGDARIRIVEADQLGAANLTANNVIVGLAKSEISKLDLTKLDAGRLSITGEKTSISVRLLQVDGGNIRETLVIQHVKFQTVTAANLTVAKRTMFLGQTFIEQELDLPFSNLGNFDWEFRGDDPFRLPAKLNIEGATFSNLRVVPTFSHPPTTPPERQIQWRARHTDYGLAFLEKATYFEPAYETYEALLKTQGRGDASDAVYFAMRDRRRYTEWTEAETIGGQAVAGMNYMIGFGHKWLFGYGRSWVYPIVWCVVFILAGAIVFRNVALMEEEEKQPASPFSSLWYTIDLFVPVLSLGLASRWHPKGDRRFLMFYAKLLSLVGLVFLSAALGALTGSLK